MDELTKRWQASHAAWDSAFELQLMKLNRSRGFFAEGTSLIDDESLLRKIPAGMLAEMHLTASDFAAPEASDDDEHPFTKFFAKLQLDALTGESQTLAKSAETDFQKWLQNALSEVQPGRPTLPTHDSLLAKGALASRLTKLVNSVRHLCQGNEEYRLEMGLKSFDYDLICELAEQILGRAGIAAAA